MREKTWTAVITTAPRRDPTIHLCVESLRVCGWHPVVIAEPESPKADCETIYNQERKGVWRNWVAACEYALKCGTEYIVTVQDDSLLHPDSKVFLEQIEWPHQAAFVSLYTPKHYAVTKSGWRGPGLRQVRTRSLWGACALAWKAETLRSMLRHPVAQNWLGAAPRTRVKVKNKWVRRKRSQIQAIYEKRRKAPHTIANSDTAIGKVANAMRLGMWFVDPSAVSHIAEFSACGHGGNTGRRNAFKIADFNKPLIEQVFR